MSLPILFLDIDGVLNGHEYNSKAQSNTLRSDCVNRLNRIISETNCRIVVSSAWRYMILGGSMTLLGFKYLLRTHGLTAQAKILDHLGPDTQTEDSKERGKLIKSWLAEHPGIKKYVVVDDLDLDFSGLPFVKTDGKIGLTDENVDEIIRLLNVKLLP